MDGYVTPPMFPINPPLNALLGAGMQHLFNQLQAHNQDRPLGPKTVEVDSDNEMPEGPTNLQIPLPDDE